MKFQTFEDRHSGRTTPFSKGELVCRECDKMWPCEQALLIQAILELQDRVRNLEDWLHDRD